MNNISKEILYKKLKKSLYQIAGKTIDEASYLELYYSLGNLLKEEIGKI